MATFLSGFLEAPTESEYENYDRVVAEGRQKIWRLIDKYIEEEEVLIQELIDI